MSEDKPITVWMFRKFSYDSYDEDGGGTYYIDMDFTSVKDTMQISDEEFRLLQVGGRKNRDCIYLYRDSRQDYNQDIKSAIENGRNILKREEEKQKKNAARNKKAELAAAERKIAKEKKKLEELKKKFGE